MEVGLMFTEWVVAGRGCSAAKAAIDRHTIARLGKKREFILYIKAQNDQFWKDPEWGGNRNEAGWKLIGFEDAGMYQPPFGYYDGAK